MDLRSATCAVRSFRPDDAVTLAHHGNNRKIWENLRDRFPHPYTVGHAEAYIGFVLSNPGAMSYAIEVDGQAVGGFSMHPREDIERIGAEIGYWIGEAFWGRGIATAAISLVTDHLLARPDTERVFAVPLTTNTGSCRALEKAGFLCEGTMRKSALKDGRVRDQFLYAKVKG